MQFPFTVPKMSRQTAILFLTMVVLFCGIGASGFFFKKLPQAPVLMIMDTLTLAGRGDLQPLHMVAAKDSTLLNMLKDLTNTPAAEIFSKHQEVDMKVADLLFRWAEADMAQKGEYGPYIDARVASFLKRIGSVPSSFTPGSEIPIKDATNLTQLWFKVFDRYRIRLLAQTSGKAIYDGGVSYNLNTDALTISKPISPAFLKDFQSELQKSNNSGDQMRAFLDFVDATKGFDKLTDAEQDMIMGVEVKKPVASAHGVSATPGMPGKDKLPAINATP
ncbi:MAG: hypothetical protein JWO78_2214 [Micavibrio sp.]|nr:hypothetical protein [Micavibrio sp.]